MEETEQFDNESQRKDTDGNENGPVEVPTDEPQPNNKVKQIESAGIEEGTEEKEEESESAGSPPFIVTDEMLQQLDEMEKQMVEKRKLHNQLMNNKNEQFDIIEESLQALQGKSATNKEEMAQRLAKLGSLYKSLDKMKSDIDTLLQQREAECEQISSLKVQMNKDKEFIAEALAKEEEEGGKKPEKEEPELLEQKSE